MTLEDALTMRLGLQWDEWSEPYGDANNDLTILTEKNIDQGWALLNLPVQSDPGTNFTYNTAATIALGQSLENAVGVPMEDFAEMHLFQPLQIDDNEILVAALNLCGIAGNTSQLGCGFAAGEDITGFRTKGVLQAQATGTYIRGATLGADQVFVLGEVGLTWVPDLESKGDLRYEGAPFGEDTSWGYVLVVGVDFLSAVGAVNLSPAVAFSHDVSGVTPTPIGNFVEDRKTVTLSLTASYLNDWRARVSYTNFFGAGKNNSRNDRDFVSTVVSYAF